MWEQAQLFPTADRPYTVSELTAQIRARLEREPFHDLWVEGELSNLSRPSSGHIYFTLKDAGAQLAGVMWRTQAQRLRSLPRDGERVRVHGRLGVYEAGGKYQLYADHLEAAGIGALSAEFERLKARLGAEGLFAPERKRPLPPFPRRIGVVTSPTTAALRDVLTVLRRRYPLAEVVLSPTPVQGDAAPPQIAAALAALNAREDVDVLLLVRGGGSLEDLWAFNDERVARAVANSRIPVVSGVGHETDFSLADFAADLRAPTPTAAAELATPDRAELRAQLWQRAATLERATQGQLQARQARLERVGQGLDHLSPARQLQENRQRLDSSMLRLETALAHRRELAARKLEGMRDRLEALNPERVLQRGYAIVRERKTGRVLSSTGRVYAARWLTLQLQDGQVPVVVEGIEEEHRTRGMA